MMHKLTGGLWGQEAQPALRRIAGLLPLMLLCWLPLIGAIALLLPFLDRPVAELPERVAAKLGYLQPTWIIVRTLVVAGLFLLIWRTYDRSRRASVLGLIGYMIGLTVFTTDWMQALDPSYYSTIYPVEVAGAQILGAFALVVLLVPVDAKGDFGKILLAALLSWAYFAAMQWLISWMGDLPDEAEWYLRRLNGVWPVPLVLMLGLFAVVPFFALLPQRVRGSLPNLRIVAGIILVGYAAESLWRIGPAHG
ncbi:MAG TPA: hypothetical protein VG966_12700 [Hyphomicrobiaceae bacterium]|nr:hypothetical protein [Hyphomicrobiaceae bacterium]